MEIDGNISHLLAKMESCLQRWKHSSKSNTRAIVEFMPTLNQKSEITTNNGTTTCTTDCCEENVDFFKNTIDNNTSSTTSTTTMIVPGTSSINDYDSSSSTTTITRIPTTTTTTTMRIPYIRPKFGKKSAYIRLAAKNDSFNKYPEEYVERNNTGKNGLAPTTNDDSALRVIANVDNTNNNMATPKNKNSSSSSSTGLVASSLVWRLFGYANK